MRPPSLLRAFAGARSVVARRPAPGAEAQRAAVTPGSDTGWFLAVELVTATLVWGGIGWLADRWLGTGPWLMLAGFVVGHCAGFYLIWLKTEQAVEAERLQREARQAPVPRVPAPRAHG